MEDLQEITLSKKCIIISPDELAKLTNKIRNTETENSSGREQLADKTISNGVPNELNEIKILEQNEFASTSKINHVGNNYEKKSEVNCNAYKILNAVGVFKKTTKTNDSANDNTKLGDTSVHENSKSKAQDQIDLNGETKLCNKSTYIEENKAPKKRGRPKKSSLEMYESVVISSDANKNMNLNESLIVSGNKSSLENKACKKRGRPRKSSIAITETIANPNDTNDDMIVNESLIDSDKMASVENKACTKRGRPRKSSLAMAKTIASDSDTNKNPRVTESLLNSDNMTSVENKAGEELDRPRKSSLGITKTIATPSDTNEDMGVNELLLDSDNMTTVENKTCKKLDRPRKSSSEMTETIATPSDRNYDMIVNESLIDCDKMASVENKACTKRGRPRKSSLAVDKTVASHSETNKDPKVNESLINSDNMTTVEKKAGKKLDRPRKSSLEISKTIATPSDTNDDMVVNESLIDSDKMTSIEKKACTKRGRPRKTSLAMTESISTIINTNNDMSLNESLMDSDNMTSVENKVCKNRGRPRKSSLEVTKTIATPIDTNDEMSANESLIDSDNLISVENKTCKKHGRPRNSSLEMPQTIATPSDTNKYMIVNESLIDSDGITSVKNEAPKKDDTDKSATIDDSLVTNNRNTAPKKRGRPKKNSLPNETVAIHSTETNENTNLNESLLTISKKGRKRKIVDYSFLDDPDLSEKDHKSSETINNKKIVIKSDEVSVQEASEICEILAVPVDTNENVTMGGSLIVNDSTSTVMNTVPKKRGRPKKNSLLNETVGTPSDTKINSPIIENTIIVESVLTTSKRGRKRKLVDYSLLDDLDLSEKDHKFSESLKNEKIVSKSDEVSVKEASEMCETLAVPFDTNENVTMGGSLIGNDSTSAVINVVHKKRGRPKKNSLLNETAGTPSGTKNDSQINENTIIDESLLTTSKKGRKVKKVDYSFLHDLDYAEVALKKEKIVRESDQVTIKECSSIKNEEDNADVSNNADVVPKNADVVSTTAEKDLNESTNYRWTGNATKAITQMLNIIHDKDIGDVSHDPLAGKIKRGRPKIHADKFLDEDGTTVCMVCNETIPNSEWLTHKKKVHYNLAWRKGTESLDLSNQNLVLKTITLLKQEKGYLRCHRCKAKYKKPKKFISHIDECNGVVDSTGCITCDVCKTEMDKDNWQYHNYRQHNNLAWRVGDPPLNLEDQDLVLRILNALYKAKRPLHCEKCGLQKKSVMGYLSHKTTCQKSESELEDIKISCEICGKKVLPVSMDYHLKAHDNPKVPKYALDESNYFAVTSVFGKRRAAEQALQVINNIKGHCVEESQYFVTQCDFKEDFVRNILKLKFAENPSLQCIFEECGFASEIVDNLVDHLNSCEKKPSQYFLCKYCISLCKEETEIQNHLKTQHNITYQVDQDADISLDEDNNSENDELLDEEEREKKRLRLKEKRKLTTMSNIRVKPLFLVYPIRETTSSLIYKQAYVWMTEFCEQNYGDLNLYQHLRNRHAWKVLDCDILSDYLPRNLLSCDVTAVITSKTDDPIPKENFRKMELFDDCSFHEGEVTIFCGGPITALAWLPTPYNQNNLKQVLAVATLNDPDSHYRCNQNYYEPSVVQFWDFGEMSCHQTNIPKPSLLFGLAVPYGPIWHLEWCPSGCFDFPQEDSKSRLGLLAVAASDSFVYIYSIDNLADDSDRGLIFKGEPILKLQMHCDITKLDGQLYYPTKISWSKAAGHRYIAVGYSNGIVALFDLQIESSLLQRDDQGGTKIIFAYKSFQAHISNIIALTLNHLSGGNKWLFTASHDRNAVFWDLTHPTKITCTKRNTLGAGIWLTQWPTFIAVEDESTYNDKVYAHCFHKSIRNIMSSDGSTFTFALSGIGALSYSDWLNTIFQGSNSGEVMAQFAHRMFYGLDVKLFKSNYIRSLFSTTKLLKKDNIPNNEHHLPITYNEASEKYNLAFLDYKLDYVSSTPNSNSKRDLNGSRVSRCDLREFCLQSVNKIVSNPNPQACSFYAAGYQAGFVRLRNIQFLRTFCGN